MFTIKIRMPVCYGVFQNRMLNRQEAIFTSVDFSLYFILNFC
ncbi:Uncharacterized protein dnm_054140 [Desulfonema magnum]|uniref:Uncharacterized protein n=1 Tax=Desulfonema magnum TaxID=45655 RepID=A0A975BPP9_9BACT|nr:Uncharacterized protein dnm_054140 [Desulfonema magnum]